MISAHSKFSLAVLMLLAFSVLGQNLTYRNWMMASGKKSDVTLALIEQDAATVRLKRRDDGRVIRVRINQLSRDDQSYLLSLARPAQAARSNQQGWTQFRGPNAQGRIPAGDYPTEWTETKNVKWKIVPGPGASSPIIAGKRLFYTTYSVYGTGKAEAPGDPRKLLLHLICLDNETGKTVWKKNIPHRGDIRPFEGAMQHMGYAAHTPVIENGRIYCHFGNHGVVAFDIDGKQLWEDGPYPFVETKYGSRASPTLYKNLLLVNTSMEDSTLRACDKTTGREVWKMEKNEWSYTTPTLIQGGNDPLMMISGRH